ncbi:Phage protein [Xanthomonas phage Tenjo]|nr:Phage protein [Xanthomonas phage Tenjo]
MGKYSEIIAATQAEDDQARARAAGVTAPQVDPDAMGRAMRLADQRGLPPGVVADNLPEYDQQQQQDALGDAASASPVLARWLGDPNHSALSKDDTGVLAGLGRQFNSGLLSAKETLPWLPLPQSALDLDKERKAAAARGPEMRASPDPSWFSEMVGKFQSGWYQGKAGFGLIPLPNLGDANSRSVEEQVARGLGYQSAADYDTARTAVYVADQSRRAQAADVETAATAAGFQEIADAEKTKDTGKIARAVVTNPRAVMAVVAQSLGNTAPQLALSAAMPASRVVAGVTAGTGSFATEQGMTILDVMGDAGVETSDPAAVSAFLRNKPAMEKARQKALARGVAVGTFDALTAGFAGRLIANSRRTAVSITGRVAGEAAVQAGGGAAGEATAQLASEGKITSQSDIFLEAAAEMPTFLAEGRGQIAEARRAAMHNADRFDAHQEQRAISDLVNLASQSKTRERSATRFESLIRDMTSEGEDTIYLSADGAQRLFQSANSEGGPDLGGLVDSDALREAIATGGEVAIPLAKYATLVTPELHAAVADQVRLQPGGRHDLPAVSSEEIQQAIDQGLAEAQQQDARENGPAGQVYDDVVGQLLSRQDEQLARQNASVVQSVYRNLAERVGTDAWTLYQQFKLRIPGATTDTRARPRGVDIDVDPFLDALRSGKMPTDREIYGDTLVSALHAAGGLRDSGGELANMDAAKARPGLVNNLAGMSLDDALVWAYQEGFITQAPTNQQEGAYDADAPDINTLLDMLAQDLGGNPVYRPAAMNAERAAFRDSALGLQDELDQRGIDLQQTDNATARQALGYANRTLEQGQPVESDGVDYAVRDLVAGPSGRPESAATRALVDQAVADGDLAKMLQGIATQEGIDADQAALALRLAEITPDLNVTMVAAPANANAAGIYNNTTNEIWIHQAVPSVVLHEVLHGVTSAMMTSPTLRRSNTTVARAVAEFNDLLGAAQAHFAGMETDGADVPAALRATLQDPRGPLSNIKELLTYGMTDKRFQEWLATVPAPAGREESRTAWQWFKDAIATMLGVTGQERTALDALIESTSDLVDFAQANPRAANFAQMSEANRLGVPITDAAALNQGGEKPRGAVTFEGVPGARVFNIELLKGMDASTFMHEMGHVYLEVLNDLAARDGAPAQITNDMATLNAWLGREAGTAFTVDQHEQFARGFEAYLREGKAPSSALRRTFAAFKVWLTALYRSVRSLNVELTDDVRNVMDRIVASDAEIEDARAGQYQGALIADGMAVGMTFEQLQAYNEAVNTARADAEATVAAEVLLAERREQQAWYNREKREVRAQVLEEVRNLPVYRAQRLLRNGKLPNGDLAPDELRVKLSKDELLDKFGQSFLRNLVGMYSVEGGVRGDEAAAIYGFGSGRELIESLVNAPRLADAVASETEARMKDRHPDPMTDGTLPDRAMIAAHRDRQADVMVREIRALEQHVNGRQVSQAAVIKGVARQIIQDKKLRHLQPATYRSAEARAGREAFEAAAKQDWGNALAARRRQLLNFELFREAVRARDEAARTAKYLAKFGETKTRARLGKAGADYLDQVDGLLDRFDFRKISDKAADRRSSLATWIEVQAQKGIDVNLPPKIMDEAFTIPYREMTVADLATLRDAIRSIDHLARLKGKLLLAGEVRDAAEVDAAMAASLAAAHEARPITTGDRGPKDRLRQAFMQGRVIQATATDMARELDGFKDQGAIWMNTVGVMRDAVNNRLNPALQQAQDELAQVYVKHYSKAEIRGFSERVPMPEVNGDLWSKSRLLGLALNWGNAGNREAILTQARGRMSPEQVNALLSKLDSRDWAFVEDVWRLIDSQWPAIADAQKRRTGLVPERVQASAFTVQTSDGKTLQIPGGYYPLKYESDSVKTMKDEADDFYNSIRTGRTAKAATRNGHTIERVGSGGRTVRLDTGVVQQHLRDVLRDVHLGDAVNYVHNVLNGQEFKEAVDSTGTQEYRQALEVWLKDAAAGEIGPRVWHERAMRAARQNFTASVLTFKVTSALLQLSGVVPTIVTIGQGHTMAGIGQYLGKPRAMTRYVREASPYMDSRLRTHIEAVQTVMDAEAGRFAAGKAASIRFGYWMIGRVQGLVDTVTWLAAEQAGMAKFGNDVGRARAYADDVVTRAQGSGEFIDKSPLQRGTLGDNVRQTEWIKATTALQGYMIAKGNLAYEQTRKANLRNPRQAMKWAADMVMLFSVEGLLTAALTAKLPNDDDDDGLWDDLGEWAIKDALSTFFGVIPGGGVLVDQFRGYDSSGVVAGAWRAYAELLEKLTPGEDGEVNLDKGVAKAAVSAAGVTLGLPSTQVNKTIDAIAARADGRDVSPYEYLTGPKKEPK